MRLMHGVAMLMLFCTQGYTQNKSVYLEALGSGVLGSLNYDMRFNQTNNGLGMRVGVGYLGIQDDDFIGTVTLPVQVNYVFGEENKHFELGLGATIVFGEEDDIISDFAGNLVMGYRFQKPDGGLLWRISLTPFFKPDNPTGAWLGISIGYAW